MATFQTIQDGRETLNEMRAKLSEIDRVFDFAELGGFGGNGVIDNVPFSSDQMASIVATYTTLKAQLIPIFQALP